MGSSAKAISFKNAKKMTKESFADECNFSKVIKKAAKTGVMPVNGRMPVYGDFTSAEDYHSLQNCLIAVQDEFMKLDPLVRRRFNNDPAQVIDFLSNPANDVEAVKLGLLDKKVIYDKVAILNASKPVGTGNSNVENQDVNSGVGAGN